MILVAIDPGKNTGFVQLKVDVETQSVEVLNIGILVIEDIVSFRGSILQDMVSSADVVCYETWIQLTNATAGTVVNEIIGAIKLTSHSNAVVKGQIASTRLICEKPLGLKKYSHDPDDISAFKHAMSWLLINKFIDPDKVNFINLGRAERAFIK